MSKKRVYELAKDLDVANKELIKMMGKMDIEVKNHMSTMDESQVAKMTNYYKRGQGGAKKVPSSQGKTETTKAKTTGHKTTEERNSSTNQKPSTPRPASNNNQGSNNQNRNNNSNNNANRSNDNRNRNSNTSYRSDDYRGNNNRNNNGNNNNANRSNDNRNSNTSYRSNDNRNSNYRGNNNNTGNSSNYRGNNNNNNSGNSSNYRGNNNNNTGNSSNYRGNNNNNNSGNSSNYRGNNNNTGGNSSNYRGNNNNNSGNSSNYRGNNNNNTGGNSSNYRGNNNNSSNSSNYRGNNNNSGGNSSNYRGNNNNTGGNSSNYRGNNNNSGGNSSNYRGNNNNTGGNSSNYRGNNNNSGGNSSNYRGNNNNTGGNSSNYRGNNNNSGGNSSNYRGNNNNNTGGNSSNYRGNNNNSGGNSNYRGNNNSGGNSNYRGNNNSGGNSNYRGNNQGGRPNSGQGAPVKKEPTGFLTKNKNNKKHNNNSYNAKPKKSRAAYRKEKREAAAAIALQKEIERESVGVMEEDGVRMIQVPDTITVKNLSLRIGVQVSEVVKVLFTKGIMTTANQEVDYEMAEFVADSFDVLVEKEEVLDILETFFVEEEDTPEELESRSPVVVVMGHVDHGKTSLLDAIRDSSVTEGEHGGITQHIGASVVTLPSGDKVTFLDTPGHEAFTAMRLRGAKATDIAVLVVAADDGVMPQTIEAINHAKAAGVQIIIAINKIDKPGANPDRVKQELVEYELITEDWGGDTIAVPVSALQRTNLDQLLENIMLVTEMEELKANPKKKAKGIVIESQLDKGRGPVATVLVQGGTLKVGDSIVAGTAYGRIRAMFDDRGNKVKEAGPSTPVEVLGLSEVPIAGETFYTAKNEREARHVAEKVKVSVREKMLQHTPHKVTLDDLFTQIQAGEMKELKLIVKADVQGSVEAVKQSLLKLSNEEVVINIIHGGVGAVNESDVMLASASNAIIIAFNVRPENSAKITADREEIDIRLYRVIYNAIEDIELAMKGMLDPEFKEVVIGQAEVRQTFVVSGVGTIAGCYMIDGKMKRDAQIRVVRDGVVVHEGLINALKRFKDDVKEVATGYECGITVEKFNDIKEGDIIEGFVMEEVPRT